ncbi:hypothetical protein [Nocardia niigatensis]
MSGNEVFLQERRAEIKELQAVVRSDSDAVGEALSSALAEHWANCGDGPTWQKAWHSAEFVEWWSYVWGELPDYRLARTPTFSILDRLGWIASNPSPRSLCPGRRFYTRFHGDHVSTASRAAVGYQLARYIGTYRRRCDGRSPDWTEIADMLADAKGVPLFFKRSMVTLSNDGW